MGKPGVENSEKIIALVLAIVVFFWTVAGLTNLGFSLLNTIFLGWMFRNYPGLIKDKWALIWGFFSLVLGWMVGIRSYELVKLLSMAAVFVLDTLISGRAKDRNADITAIRITQSTLWTGFNTFNQIIAATTAIKLGINKNNNIPVGKIGLGIVLGIPLVVLFGSLLISADPIFEQLVLNIKWPEINPEIVARGVLAIWFFGQSLSLVRTRLKTGIVGRFEIKQFTEINIAVGMVEVLFLIYSLIQIRYWGVGAEELRAMGITYSDYTRQGYFELIATSILAWVMVIGLDQSIKYQKNLKMGQARISRVLGTMILAHVVMFVAGATQRNLLYLGAYGFTRVRLLGMALSIWIVAVAAMTLVKLWQNRNQDFLGKGLVLVTALAILGLNLANIDRMIVKYQPASLPTGIDYPYLAQLSDDAWEGWEKIVEEQIDQLKKGIDETRVIIDSKITREAINSREDRLKDLKSNYWNYGGGWNWASFNSERELKRIRAYERLDDAIKEAEVKMFQTIKLKNNELVVQRANQLAQYLINMKRDWRIIHPYKTEFKSNISRVEIGIETEGSMVENMYSELIGVINYQGGGMCQWGNSYLVNNQKYMSIISCEIGQ